MEFFIGFAGKNPNGENRKAKSASRPGNPDRGMGSGSISESDKPRGSAFGYAYPTVDYQVYADLKSKLMGGFFLY